VPFQVLQAGAVTRGVVGEGQHVVGFVVGEMETEQAQVPVDGLDQADLPGQGMDGPDAAAVVGIVEAPLDPAQLLAYLSLA
jgi:hypothetical protein